MILKNRLFKRQLPSREAKSIFIFCEGQKREYQYFNYFKEIDSRINIEVYKLSSIENNSPQGLLNIAKKNILVTNKNKKPKYDFHEQIDEVWLVFDTDKDDFDSRKEQINKVYIECSNFKNWFVAQSNPCFEVWLYYHRGKIIPQIKDINKCSSWKKLVNEKFIGGFDSRKHPILFKDAIIYSEKNLKKEKNDLQVGSTEVFKLAKSINNIISDKIKNVISENE